MWEELVKGSAGAGGSVFTGGGCSELRACKLGTNVDSVYSNHVVPSPPLSSEQDNGEKITGCVFTNGFRDCLPLKPTNSFPAADTFPAACGPRTPCGDTFPATCGDFGGMSKICGYFGGSMLTTSSMRCYLVVEFDVEQHDGPVTSRRWFLGSMVSRQYGLSTTAGPLLHSQICWSRRTQAVYFASLLDMSASFCFTPRDVGHVVDPTCHMHDEHYEEIDPKFPAISQHFAILLSAVRFSQSQ